MIINFFFFIIIKYHYILRDRNLDPTHMPYCFIIETPPDFSRIFLITSTLVRNVESYLECTRPYIQSHLPPIIHFPPICLMISPFIQLNVDCGSGTHVL